MSRFHLRPSSVALSLLRVRGWREGQYLQRHFATQAELISPNDHAVLSVFDLFSVGVGPSSSHTVGPMRAARSFVKDLTRASITRNVHKIKVNLYGSLAATGKGHMTPEAILMGLEGEAPESIVAKSIPSRCLSIQSGTQLYVDGLQPISFVHNQDLNMSLSPLPRHPNAMTISAFSETGDMLATNSYYSVGGGFVESEATEYADSVAIAPLCSDDLKTTIAHPRLAFTTASDLLAIAVREDLTIHEVMMANERMWRNEKQIEDGLVMLWEVMKDSIAAGLSTDETILPGGLNLRRRAPSLYKGWSRMQALNAVPPTTERRLLPDINLLSCFAIAVNETNASGGRVVTAPTNGAAGVIPAVLNYLLETTEKRTDHRALVEQFLLTSAAIGMLCKKRATISAAEGGCMAEIGVATSMAAAGLTSCLGGTVKQVLMAAEIGLEHNLGLTCDPIAG
ncbi:hypothetical protein FFLO_02763 [Filobasidium floriforme]|uniref:L-serine ammonia-lyase n=1 Tax=Filobasidium floriforme TaxID=5210 RepID=A0A8K0JMD0_9TREE|nr:hypothetical protein FFLO_02763 [Filobasidium floriforme]